MPKTIFDRPSKKRQRVDNGTMDVLEDPMAARVAARHLQSSRTGGNTEESSQEEKDWERIKPGDFLRALIPLRGTMVVYGGMQPWIEIRKGDILTNPGSGRHGNYFTVVRGGEVLHKHVSGIHVSRGGPEVIEDFPYVLGRYNKNFLKKI